MKLNDEIVIADINDKKHILILDNIENVIDASTINAYDLNGKQYTITLDIIGFNSKIGKAYFEYYLNDNPTLTDNEYDSLLMELFRLEDEYPQYKLPESPTQTAIAIYATHKLSEMNYDVTVVANPAAMKLIDISDPEKYYVKKRKNIDRQRRMTETIQ